jgi:uncharacterized membrane protein YkvA (DUF1232 family)
MIEFLRYEARLVWRLLTDNRIPLWHKLVPLGALLYILSPIDIIPDFLIGLGQLDDLGILIGSWQVFKSLVPDYILHEHQDILDGKVVDVTDYEVIDDSDDSDLS